MLQKLELPVVQASWLINNTYPKKSYKTFFKYLVCPAPSTDLRGLVHQAEQPPRLHLSCHQPICRGTALISQNITMQPFSPKSAPGLC